MNGSYRITSCRSFKAHRLSQITIAEVDRYRTAEVKQGELSVASINKTITRLGQILEVAREYGLIESNPAKGKRRRLKPAQPAPVWLDSAQHIEALLDGASELDHTAKANGQIPRRAILATLVVAGLRIEELINLRWRDVDLAAGRIIVNASKTDARMRTIDTLPVLRDELATLKANAKASPDTLVFPTQDDGPMNPSNVRNRILARAVERANARPGAQGQAPFPRRTHASQAAPHLRQPARCPRRRRGSRDGSTRPHRPDLHAAGLPSRDAPR
jgi:integrase